MYLKRFFLITVSGLSLVPATVKAEYPPAPSPTPADTMKEKHELTMVERLNLAKQFVTKISKSLKASNDYLRSVGMDDDQEDTSQLPDGEQLLFKLRLKPNLPMEAPVLAVTDKGKVLVSLRDFVGALDLPIKFDETTGKAEGWYIREKKTFILDSKARKVTTDNGTFQFSDRVKVEEGDVFVPVKELSQWFNFKIKTTVSALDFVLDSPIKLPIQEAMERRDRLKDNAKVGPPILPQQEDNQKILDYPFVDVSSNSSYTKPGDGGEAQTKASSAIRTAGDLAFGTLTTQTQVDKDEKLQSFRANYKREAVEPELLGPLHARRYELGDVNPVTFPLQQNNSQGLGARVTNADPLRSYLQPSTEISGTYFPDWDVELYRDNQLLDFQTIGEDGQYRFENVDLYTSGNNFRLVFYGPQGEVKEEPFDVPVDIGRLSDEGSSYDIAVTSQDMHSYDKNKSDIVDKGAPLLTALYETPLNDYSAANVGLEAGQLNEQQQLTIHGGVAVTVGDALLNFDAAMDQNNEMAGQIVAREDFGKVEVRNEFRINTDHYKASIGENTESAQEILKNDLNINGPLPFDIGRYARYNIGLTYLETSDNENLIDTSLGFNAGFGRLSFSEQLEHSMASQEDESTLNSLTSLSGYAGRNRLRLTSNYQIMPENKLSNITADVQRKISKDVDLDFNIDQKIDPQVTTGTAQVNWNAGFANISPSISYDTEQNISAVLNTRFGVLRDPQNSSLKYFDRSITSNGAITAFVFLDKNGNNIFDEDDEPIQDASIHAPQNGGNVKTDEKGYAVLTNVSRLRLTDVFVDPNTLSDPYWIPGYEGASVLPREGHVAELEFPVHVSGEMDGTIYARNENGNSHPLRSMSVSLYDYSGKKVMSTSSESDGYYLLSKIPPGNYYLVVDDRDVVKNYARPLPQKVAIDFKGTTIFGNNIYFDENTADVPINVLANTDINEDDAPKLQGKSYALNLGNYKSQLMMGLIWFKIKSFYQGLASSDIELVSVPSKSYPNPKTGQYTLRATLKTNDIKTAYSRCQVIASKGQSCSLEILPGAWEEPKGTKQAFAK